MMKTIGFIDIHPDSPVWREHPDDREADICEDDPSLVYIFSKTGSQYTFEKTLAFNDLGAAAGIDEFHVSIPANMLDFRILNFPFSDRDKIQKVVPLELDSLIMASPDDIVFDTVTLADSGDTVDVLVAYMKKDTLQRFLAGLMHRGADPYMITSLDIRMMIDTREETRNDVLSTSVSEWLDHSTDGDQQLRVAAARTEISTPIINFRSGSFAYKKDVEKTKRALRIMLFLIVLFAMIIHGGLLTQTIMFKQKILSMTQEMHTAYKKLFPGDKRIIDELYQLKSHLKETREKSDALAGTEPLRFLKNLSQRAEPNVVYGEIHLEKGIIRMKAEARSMDDLSRIQLKLSEFLTDVSISDVKPTDRGKILFTVVAKEQRS
jgi:type II secretory pathway component PulL